MLGPDAEADLGSAGTVNLGTPIFARNPLFQPGPETVLRPRYLVGVTSGLYRASDSPVPSHVEASWLRQTTVHSPVFLSTNDTLLVPLVDVALVPGGLAYNHTDRSWRRSVLAGPTEEVLGVDGTVRKVPAPLVFPGDEGLVLRPSLPASAPAPAPAPALASAPASAPTAKHVPSNAEPARAAATAAAATADALPPRPTLAAFDPPADLVRPPRPTLAQFDVDAKLMQQPPPRPSLAQFDAPGAM